MVRVASASLAILFLYIFRKDDVAMNNIESKFPLGQIVATAGVANLMEENPDFKAFCFDRLLRHIDGDWGDLCEEDKETNEEAVTAGERIFSSYENPDNKSKKIWIITEADRSVTTILFPSEY